MATKMPPSPGFSYKTDWQCLAEFLRHVYPEVRPGRVIETALWLLQYLRTIDDAGALPVITEDGTLLRRVEDQWAVEQMVREEDGTGTDCGMR